MNEKYAEDTEDADDEIDLVTFRLTDQPTDQLTQPVIELLCHPLKKTISSDSYRVYRANCDKRKRHNSASRNGGSNLKTVSESPLKTIFCCSVQSL